MILYKKDTSAEYWPRLTEEKKNNYIAIDWSKYVDEDDETAEGIINLFLIFCKSFLVLL